MDLEYAERIAGEIVKVLEPACERIEVAGSIRRRKAEPKDIEIVFIPRMEERPVSLFDTEPAPMTDRMLELMMECGLLQRDRSVKRWGPKYKRLVHPASGMVVELFAATAENWGLILALRTGPGDFNKVLVSKPWAGGAMPFDMRMDQGFLWRDGVRLETPCEASFFGALGVPCWAPEERTVARLAGHLNGIGEVA